MSSKTLWKALLSQAYDRLCTDVLTRAGAAGLNSPQTLKVMARVLQELQSEIERDPAGFEQVLVDLGLSRDDDPP